MHVRIMPMDGKLIVYFDGICNFCNFFVNILLRLDKKQRLLFSSLQSEFAKKNLKLSKDELPDSIVVQMEDSYFFRTEAIFKILGELAFPFKVICVFRLIPKPILDFLYAFLAQNRYIFFGKKESCRVPSAEEESRFLS